MDFHEIFFTNKLYFLYYFFSSTRFRTMEGSLNNSNFNIESIFSKFTNSSKNARNSLAINQQLREAIERYTNLVSTDAPSKNSQNDSISLVNIQSTSSNLATNNLALSMVQTENDVAKIKTGGTRVIYNSRESWVILFFKKIFRFLRFDVKLNSPIFYAGYILKK